MTVTCVSLLPLTPFLCFTDMREHCHACHCLLPTDCLSATPATCTTAADMPAARRRPGPRESALLPCLLSADEDCVAAAQVARVLGPRQVGHQLQVVSVTVDKPSHGDDLGGRGDSVKLGSPGTSAHSGCLPGTCAHSRTLCTREGKGRMGVGRPSTRGAGPSATTWVERTQLPTEGGPVAVSLGAGPPVHLRASHSVGDAATLGISPPGQDHMANRHWPYMLGTGPASRGEGHREVQSPVRGQQLLLLEDGVEPVSSHTPLPLPEGLRTQQDSSAPCRAAAGARGSGRPRGYGPRRASQNSKPPSPPFTQGDAGAAVTISTE